MLSIINKLFDEPAFSKHKYSFFLNNESDKAKYQKKIENAKKEYSNMQTDSESTIFLFDDTVFGSAKNGFFFTLTTIYCDAFANKDGIELKDIDSLGVNTPIERKIFLKNSNQLDMGHIYFTTKDDKDIQKIILPLLSKYILISRLVAALGEYHNESEILDKASEVSLEDFKEQLAPDPKTLYREKVASGEIDPTEISFEEFKESLKPDLKSLYKEKIANGEIDPTEVSFDEFKAEYENEDSQKYGDDDEEGDDDMSSTIRLDTGRLHGGEMAIGKFDDEEAEAIQEAYDNMDDADEFYDKFVEVIQADSGAIHDVIAAAPDNICREYTPWMQEDESIYFDDIECEQASVSKGCEIEEGYPETASSGLISFNDRCLADGIYSMVFVGGKGSHSINIKGKNIDEIADDGIKYLAHDIELSFGVGASEDGVDHVLSPEGDCTSIYIPKTFWQNNYNDIAAEYEIEENGDELLILDEYIQRVVIFKVEDDKTTRLFIKDFVDDKVFFK